MVCELLGWGRNRAASQPRTLPAAAHEGAAVRLKAWGTVPTMSNQSALLAHTQRGGNHG
jgi:hypothetical protein